jgi:YggT family protein
VTQFALVFGRAIDALGYLFFVLAAILAIVALLDWAVRTRRISPFNPIARFFRSSVDPLITPVERRVVRAGGLPANAPWWALAGVVLAGIVTISLLRFIQAQLLRLAALSGRGPAGIYILLVTWSIAVLQIALIVRIISSWFRISPYSVWVRWAFTLTEPILGRLRRVIPPTGMIDFTPLIAYFGLMLLEWILLGFAR